MALLLSSPLLTPPNPNPNSRHLRITLTNPRSLHLRPIRSSITLSPNPNPNPSFLTGSTRTLTSLAALALTLSRRLLSPLPHLAPILTTTTSLFFARAKSRPSGLLNTPLTVVAAGMSKWLDIYSGILMVRVLLSWFPNIPWDRQPLSAIRDLCDPYLNLFRNIIPPVFDTLDVSPLLAFAVLGTLGSMLNNTRMMSY